MAKSGVHGGGIDGPAGGGQSQGGVGKPRGSPHRGHSKKLGEGMAMGRSLCEFLSHLACGQGLRAPSSSL